MSTIWRSYISTVSRSYVNGLEIICQRSEIICQRLARRRFKSRNQLQRKQQKEDIDEYGVMSVRLFEG